jgi:hypothetical protein
VLSDGTIGVIYEKDDYQAITFARLGLDWVVEKR